MRARNLLSGAAYGPERLKLIYLAFDHAWAGIKPLVEDTPLAHDAARLKLANLILEVAKDEDAARATITRATSNPDTAGDTA